MELQFGKRLKELRREKGLTQSQLAKVFNVSRVTITHWERGDQLCSLEMLVKIVLYFQVPAGYLLGLED